MKHSITFLGIVFSTGLLFSCGNTAKEENSEEKGAFEQISESVGAMKNLGKIADNAKGMEARMEELKALTPVSNDVLKAVLPETLAGLKRKSLNVGDLGVVKMSTASGRYENEDGSKSFEVEIMDGAGEEAGAMVSLLFLGLGMDREEITEDGFEKTQEIDGKRAMVKEHTYEENKDSEIQTIHDERFVVTLRGNGYSLDELTDVFKGLDLSQLK